MKLFDYLADRIIARAKRSPYSHIGNGFLTDDPEKADYMCRWHLIKPSRFPFSCRVHHIKREDSDRHMHTHPFNAVSLILKGGYWEERPSANGTVKKWRGPGSLVFISHKDLHRITEVAEGGAWTLFNVGSRKHSWGFLVPYKEYLGSAE